MTNTCFVIMPIGTQKIGDRTITEEELKKKYGYIIKNAVLQADSTLEVIRADEVINPSSMSNDIFAKLMNSKYVIADITYPNPNVFYELGIRHAISYGTVLIREKCAGKVPFDISHLRYIEYTQDPGGMEALAAELKTRFAFYDRYPNKPDNQFLELCDFTNYIPEVYNRPRGTQKSMKAPLLTLMHHHPELLQPLLTSTSKEEKKQALIKVISNDPVAIVPLLEAFLSDENH